MANHRRGLATALLTIAFAFTCLTIQAKAQGLTVGFYENSCPTVEAIIWESMRNSYNQDPTVAPGVLRLSFHDCFVRGCDASVLLDGEESEKTAAINVNLHGFEAIDAAKAAVEAACPNTVSCADILQFAARDSVTLTGGEGWDVSGGRRDSLVSSYVDPPLGLPLQTNTVSELLANFAEKNLNAAHMVALSGGHSIGIAHCQYITDRLYDYPNSDTGSDPTLTSDLLATLKTECPNAAATPELNVDEVTPDTFDSQYFSNVVKGRGLLASDQRLMDDNATRDAVLANNGPDFGGNFGRAMVVMARYNVLIGNAGQIRTNCRQVN